MARVATVGVLSGESAHVTGISLQVFVLQRAVSTTRVSKRKLKDTTHPTSVAPACNDDTRMVCMRSTLGSGQIGFSGGDNALHVDTVLRPDPSVFGTTRWLSNPNKNIKSVYFSSQLAIALRDTTKRRVCAAMIATSHVQTCLVQQNRIAVILRTDGPMPQDSWRRFRHGGELSPLCKSKRRL